jgi:hypothetical protein
MTTQRVVLHSDCLEFQRKSSGTFSRIQEEFKVKCSYEDEPHNRALRPYDCPAVSIYVHDLAYDVVGDPAATHFCMTYDSLS